jgi:tetratricopeptide (TPR) repeat protein
MTEEYTREPLDLALSLNKDAAEQMRTGNYKAAERSLLQAAMLANDLPADVASFFLPQLILIAVNEARLQALLKNSSRAKEIFLSALDTVRSAAVTDLRFFPALADILLGLSPLHEKDGELEKAEKLLLEANELGDHLPRSDQYNYSEHVLRSCDALAGLAHFYQRSVPDRDASIEAAVWAIRLYTIYDFEGDKRQDVADLRDMLHKWDISFPEIDERVAKLEGVGFYGLTLRPGVMKEPGKYLSQAAVTLNDLCEALRDRGGAGPVIAETVNEALVRIRDMLSNR